MNPIGGKQQLAAHATSEWKAVVVVVQVVGRDADIQQYIGRTFGDWSDEPTKRDPFDLLQIPD